MSDNTFTGANRWDWYGHGEERPGFVPARGSAASTDDNSEGRVLWECGLTIAVPLALAAIVGVVTRVCGA